MHTANGRKIMRQWVSQVVLNVVVGLNFNPSQQIDGSGRHSTPRVYPLVHTHRRRMAASMSHGMLVAPKTSNPLLLLPTPGQFGGGALNVLRHKVVDSSTKLAPSAPCIWTRNSVLIRREDSASPCPVTRRESGRVNRSGCAGVDTV